MNTRIRHEMTSEGSEAGTVSSTRNSSIVLHSPLYPFRGSVHESMTTARINVYLIWNLWCFQLFLQYFISLHIWEANKTNKLSKVGLHGSFNLDRICRPWWGESMESNNNINLGKQDRTSNRENTTHAISCYTDHSRNTCLEIVNWSANVFYSTLTVKTIHQVLCFCNV